METKPQIRILFSAPIWTALDYFLQNPDVENTDAEISREIKSIKKTAINIALKKLSENLADPQVALMVERCAP